MHQNQNSEHICDYYMHFLHISLPFFADILNYIYIIISKIPIYTVYILFHIYTLSLSLSLSLSIYIYIYIWIYRYVTIEVHQQDNIVPLGATINE
jgi:hypothetical protein